MKNVFNPAGIEAGDTVTLADPHDMRLGDGRELLVESVGGKNGNKVYCALIGHELYANCFTLVRKGERPGDGGPIGRQLAASTGRLRAALAEKTSKPLRKKIVKARPTLEQRVWSKWNRMLNQFPSSERDQVKGFVACWLLEGAVKD